MPTLQNIHQLVPSALVSNQDVDFEFQTSSANILSLLEVLKSHSLSLFKNCVEVTAVDLPSNSLRFYVTYFLLSTQYNARASVSVQTDELLPIFSITSLFSSVNWMEREIFDLYGIFFTQHPDLRRLLTDYGFQGHAGRVDFPLSGHQDIFYDDAKKLLSYQSVELAQSFRSFNFLSPWVQDK
jgi:NADH:ubiquinone oxidoreductase subunit C